MLKTDSKKLKSEQTFTSGYFFLRQCFPKCAHVYSSALINVDELFKYFSNSYKLHVIIFLQTCF